jgi:hypothetical protein
MAFVKRHFDNPRNGCGACGQDFASLQVFDAHRVGRHEPLERRRPEELQELGYELNHRGRWHDRVVVDRARGEDQAEETATSARASGGSSGSTAP